MRTLTVILGAAFALGFAAHAQAATWIVDAPNPAVECPNADSPTIQGAVALAAPGDHVRVCPGRFRERVTVTKPLVLLGSGPAPQVRTGDPTQESVLFAVSTAFDVQASDVDIEGFTFERNGTAIATDLRESGYGIRKNLFQQNTRGIQLETQGALETVVQENVFRTHFLAIVNERRLQNARIEENDFTRSSTSLFLQRPIQTIVRSNSFTDDATSILMRAGAIDSMAVHNRIVGGGRGISVGGGFRNSVVAYNSLFGGILDGIESSASSARIEANRVESYGGTGIRLHSARAAVVRANHLEANGRHAIALEESTGDVLVELNKGFRNGVDGIRIDEFSGLNVIRQNLMDDNGEHDCHDDGFANIWEDNLGDTSQPPGICRPTGTGREDAVTASEHKPSWNGADCTLAGEEGDLELRPQTWWDDRHTASHEAPACPDQLTAEEAEAPA